jgi:phage/plasmid-like protein (TIGR03299 family)
MTIEGSVETAFFSAREVPWHKLGTVTTGALSAEEALETAKMSGWDIRRRPFNAMVEDKLVSRKDRALVVRTSPFTGEPEVLGVTSPKYGIVSNEAAFAFLDTFGEMGGAKFETAGSLDEGRRVFVTMRLPEDVLVGGVDRVETYLLATTAHDGSRPFEGMIVPNRVVCKNTLDFAIGGALRKVRIRHNRNAEERMQQAAELLATTQGYVQSFAACMERLAAQALNRQAVDELLEQLFPAKESPQAKNQAEAKRTQVRNLLYTSPTIQEEVRLTGWGFVNAAAEWADWFSPTRADDPAYRRAVRGTLEDDGSNFKTKAMTLALA